MRWRPLEARDEALVSRYGLDFLGQGGLGRMDFERGELVLCEGEATTHLLILIQGRARVCCLGSDGRSLLYGFYDGGGMLGEVELMLDCPATTTVEAVTALTCLAVPMALASQLKASPAFVSLAARNLARKLVESSHMRAAAALYPLRARLCAYISLVAVRGLFCEKLTVLAELLGVSYRHLHRALEALCRDGLLVRRRRGFDVPDPAALQREGGGCYTPAPLGIGDGGAGIAFAQSENGKSP